MEREPGQCSPGKGSWQCWVTWLVCQWHLAVRASRSWLQNENIDIRWIFSKFSQLLPAAGTSQSCCMCEQGECTPLGKSGV